MSTAEVRCPRCGAVVHPDWDWCQACGYDPEGHRVEAAPPADEPERGTLSQGPGNEPRPPRRPPGVDRRVVVAALAAAVVVVGVAVGATVVGAGSRSANEVASSPTSLSGGDESASSTTTAPAAPGAVFGSPSEPGVSVSPDEARTVASRLWSLRMTARHARDVRGLRAVDAGAALEADLGYLCALGCEGPPLTAADEYVNVPRQTSWPAVLFATVTYLTNCQASASPCDDSFVAEQAAPGAPWYVVLYVNYSGTAYASHPAPGASGFSVASTSSPSRHLDDLPTEYASYLQALKDTGQPPASTRLAPGPFTTGLADAMYDPPSAQEQRGEQSTATYRAAPSDPIWHFAASNAVEVTCGTVRFTDTTVAVGGGMLVQPPDRSRFGNLAPGRYTTIVREGLHSICFEAYADPTQPIAVFGSWGSVTSVSGTPASS